MAKVYKATLQALTYLGFVAVVAYLSASPAYDYANADMAAIKLSLSHPADRVEPCVQLTPEQIAELAPNMRRVEQCERERLPLTVTPSPQSCASRPAPTAGTTSTPRT
jgi:hypothetical protein